MWECQVTRWRGLPSMVAARAGDETVRSELHIDRASDPIARDLDGLGR